MSKKEKRICFYHLDLDGICSAAIVKHKYPDCELVEINYGRDFDFSLVKNKVVFMVDFSLGINDMLKLKNYCKDLIWIDHHISKIKETENNPKFESIKGLRVDGKAACELTWEFIYPDKEMPYAVKLLGRYDVWDHSDKNTVFFQYGMHALNQTPNNPLWKELFDEDIGIEHTSYIIENGEIIKSYVNNQNERYCNSYSFKRKILFFGKEYNVIAVNKGLANSMLFDRFYNPKKHDFMLTFIHKGCKILVSLYTTKEELDCSKIATFFGGGGHKNAAGFTVDKIFITENSISFNEPDERFK